MVKIVHMLPALGWGGAQVFCIQLCNELANYPGYEITLVSLYDHTPNHMSVELIDKRVKFVTLGKKKGFDTKIFVKVHKLLEQIKPDVVNTHLHAGYYATWAYLKMKDVPMRKIHTFHSLVTKDAPWHGRLMYKYFFSQEIIHPVSISEEVLKGAVAEYGPSATTLIYNGSAPIKPTEKFQSVADKVNSLKKDADTKVMVNVGRIYDVKNQRVILDAFKIFEQENVNAIALIIGGHLPEEQQFYDDLVKDKPSNVQFIGKVNNVGDYLLNADAFLMPSLYEGMPISLLEAFSAGAVPVCTPVGGLLDTVKINIGFLSTGTDSHSYLAALRNYLNTNVSMLAELKANGKALYENEFSIKSCAEKYNKLYFEK